MSTEMERVLIVFITHLDRPRCYADGERESYIVSIERAQPSENFSRVANTGVGFPTLSLAENFANGVVMGIRTGSDLAKEAYVAHRNENEWETANSCCAV
jgi:hypothetical protein